MKSLYKAMNEAAYISQNKPGYYVFDYSNRTGKMFSIQYIQDNAAPNMEAEPVFFSTNIKDCLNFLLKKAAYHLKDCSISYQTDGWEYIE